jgi:hypothetical protein
VVSKRGIASKGADSHAKGAAATSCVEGPGEPGNDPRLRPGLLRRPRHPPRQDDLNQVALVLHRAARLPPGPPLPDCPRTFPPPTTAG